MTALIRRTFARFIIVLAGAALLAGCEKAPAFKNLDITGNTQFGSNFSLPDTTGKARTLGDFKDKAVVLFFGYTHCPDVCPTTLAELSQARSTGRGKAATLDSSRGRRSRQLRRRNRQLLCLRPPVS